MIVALVVIAVLLLAIFAVLTLQLGALARILDAINEGKDIYIYNGNEHDVN